MVLHPVGVMILGLGGWEADDLFLHTRAIGWALWPRCDSCAFGAAGILSWTFCNKSSTVTYGWTSRNWRAALANLWVNEIYPAAGDLAVAPGL
ncbi:hypothetical protein BDV39DRAFT_172116 [Aspergillus sergii]|uniref:Uncharacterized protein n=1 Tax=Aspergillus sergii TaxID=1034303 RepID=A0A5N6XAY4_9EURO|nr:hypothetical protein BDV39DRAFT_172116 [Aspergillus sergii]